MKQMTATFIAIVALVFIGACSPVTPPTQGQTRTIVVANAYVVGDFRTCKFRHFPLEAHEFTIDSRYSDVMISAPINEKDLFVGRVSTIYEEKRYHFDFICYQQFMARTAYLIEESSQ